MFIARHRSVVLSALACLALAGCSTATERPATASPWPSALHDARHSGVSSSAGPTTGRIRWQRKLEDAVVPGPVIGGDGTIYVSSNAGILHAIDPATGNDRWTYDSHATQPDSDLSVSPLVLPSGEILFPTPGTDLVALSPTGDELWRQPLPGRPTSPVTTNGSRVYVGDETGDVSAIDLTGDGKPKIAWKVNAGAGSYASVVTNGSGAVYTTSGTSLVAIADHGASASIAWRADPQDGDTEVSAGLAPDGTVLLGTNGTQEWAYRPDGSPLWHSPRVITYSSPSVTATGLAYVADHTGTVRVFDTRTGTQRRTYRPAKTEIWSSTVLDKDSRVYFGGQNGHVYGLSPTGAVLFDVALGAPIDSYPALTADGALIVGAANGTVAAIESY
ncbi:MAG TPA: PQQ-binding-like beta-propeller repeat protein [Pseudonocardiaceae bacterium]|nr:PQQ-binding-like beta-propeller repeat protein [Pseudonocardiaceae bacterium]